MGRFLNVGIIQMPVSDDTAENLSYIAKTVQAMMTGYHRPELVLGVEGGIGFCTPQMIPGPITDYLAKIARTYHIYFVPGTMWEIHPELKPGMYYNAAPVFNPDGELLAVYRKMAPWRPFESDSAPGKEYVVFDIPEKDTKIGVQICYDLNYPEISRNEALMGAEVLLKLTEDPEELFLYNEHLHYARALENQAYMVASNVVGPTAFFNAYGRSIVISPEGKVVWEAGTTPAHATITLDLDLVRRCREFGTGLWDHYIKHLGQFNFPMPYANRVLEAPVYQNLTPVADTISQIDENNKRLGFGELGRLGQPASLDLDEMERNLERFLREN